ncbi:LacI family DNA-binding transcriptional regulator [Terriglobus sp.]|uniref:LacI family DNA-binding transcriptional regulator n=1 Tax=Terriglobus sp. TaxID=1889013 RepID=UPI003B000AA6
MPTRLKDIANALDVSLVTVSKVLRGKTDVSAETRDRILRKMEELNYKPNMIARGLASGRSLTVGLIVPDIADPFFAELARSLGAHLRRSQYQLLLASADESAAVEQHEIENLLQRGVDALLIASCQTNATGLDAALRHHTPCVLLDRMLPGTQANFVGTDDVLAGRLATEHLFSLRRRRIAHIGSEGTSTATDRLRGYREALAAGRIPPDPALTITCDLHGGRPDLLGHDAMRQLLERPEHPDAVFCYSDLLAVGAIRAAREMGRRVPEDIAVIGCGNLPLSAYLEVPLSSIDQGTAELGEHASQLALELIGSKVPPAPKSLLVPPRVVVRASTGASAV